MRRATGRLQHSPLARRCHLLLLGLGILGAGILGALLGATPALAADRHSEHSLHTDVPATAFPVDGQGVYDSCDPRAPACVADLDTLAHARFQLVLNYSQFAADATLADEIAYATHANQVGMKVIWPVNQFIYHANTDHTLALSFPTLNASLSQLSQSGVCPGYDGSNYAFASCFVRAVRRMPGTWGYYIGDELPASREPDVRHLVDAVYDFDANRPRLYVSSTVNNGVDSTDLTAYAHSYCDGSECHPDATIIAQDFYPVGTSAQGQVAALEDKITAGVQALAQKNGASYGMVLQAHSLGQYPEVYGRSASGAPYPTEQQMLAMRDAVLAHPTPQVVLWYSYFDLVRSDNYAQHWADLVAASNAGRPLPNVAYLPPPVAPAAASAAPPQPPAPAVPSAPPTAPAAPSGAVLPVNQPSQKTSAGPVDPSIVEVLLQAGLLGVLILAIRLTWRPSAR